MPPTSNDPVNLPCHIHCVGICSRLLGGLALALQELGVRISGSDTIMFPPMSDKLANAGIPVTRGWFPDQLHPDLAAVVAGSGIIDSNPEIQEARRRHLPVWNVTAFMEEHFFRHSRNVVITGTKGKTTTTAMLTWILRSAGADPDFIIGGSVRDERWPTVRLRDGRLTVIEGDEFPCSLADKLPKLLRHHPHDLVVTNVSHDHPDVFASAETYAAVFRNAATAVPADGMLLLNSDDPGAAALAVSPRCRVKTVGFSRGADFRLTNFRQRLRQSRFRFCGVDFRLIPPGRMNAINAALAAAMAERLGVSLPQAAAALAGFPGVARRQEIVGRIGRSVIYADEAYHPLALRSMLSGLKRCHPNRRLLVMLVPLNTGGRGGMAQRELPAALAVADAALLFLSYDAVPYPNGAFDDAKLHRDLRRQGVCVRHATSLPEMLTRLRKLWRDGDTLVICLGPGPPSTQEKIVAALREEAERRRI